MRPDRGKILRLVKENRVRPEKGKMVRPKEVKQCGQISRTTVMPVV